MPSPSPTMLLHDDEQQQPQPVSRLLLHHQRPFHHKRSISSPADVMMCALMSNQLMKIEHLHQNQQRQQRQHEENVAQLQAPASVAFTSHVSVIIRPATVSLGVLQSHHQLPHLDAQLVREYQFQCRRLSQSSGESLFDEATPLFVDRLVITICMFLLNVVIYTNLFFCY